MQYNEYIDQNIFLLCVPGIVAHIIVHSHTQMRSQFKSNPQPILANFGEHVMPQEYLTHDTYYDATKR